MATQKRKSAVSNADRTVDNLTTAAKELVPTSISDLRPSGYNPRRISPEKLHMLRDAMKEFGELGSIVFNIRTGRLVGGHQRVKNLDPSWPIVKEAVTDKAGTVASGYIDTPDGRFNYREVEWDEQKEKSANIAANRHGGEFDDDLLAQLMQELVETGYDMNLTGFNQEEIDELLGLNKPDPTGDEDAVVEPVEEPFVKLGDLWVLGGGDHRLLCGDSTSIADVERIMNGEKADLCWTDPPYNVDVQHNENRAKPRSQHKRTDEQGIKNDKMTDSLFEEFLLGAFTSMSHALKPGGCFYVAHADTANLGTTFRKAINSAPILLIKQCLVWIKNSAALGRQDYNWQHEPILYGWKEGAAHYFSGDFSQTTVIDDDIDITKLSKPELIKIAKELRLREPTTVIRIDKPHKSPDHPTMKPVRLVERCIYASSQYGEIVIDLFNGSGTTLIACRKTGRRYRGIELSTAYVQSSLQRYFEYCQEEPQLMNQDGSMTPFSEVQKARKK